MRNRLIPFCAVLGLALVACGGDGDGATTTSTSTTLAPVSTPATSTTVALSVPTTIALVTEGATVIVVNGNIIGGSAGRMADALGVAGFTTGTPANSVDKVEESIVYYTAAAGAQAVAESVALALGGVAVEPLPDPIPTDTGTLDGGEVLLLLGNNQADQPLAGLSGGADPDPTEPAAPTSGLAIVVANANAIGGSAGRMSAQLEAAGFTVGTPTNANTDATDSIVYYSDAEGAQAAAESLAESLGGIDVLPLPDAAPTESGTLDGGDILLLLGSAQADKTLADLAG